MDRFATLNIGAGKTFDFDSLSAADQKAVQDGIADAAADLAALMKKINAEEISSSDMFGTREFLKNNYLHRFAGAKLGLYGNSGEEAICLAYFVDAAGAPADASKHRYQLRFPRGGLPPAKAFWSLDDVRRQDAVARGEPARALPAEFDDAGGVQVQALRVYMPAPEVANGTWKKPPLQPIP